MFLRSLAIADTDSDADDDTIVYGQNHQDQPITMLSAPSTPTGERDLPTATRKPSITIPDNEELPNIEQKYQDSTNNHITSSDNDTGLFYRLFGCLKPFMSVVNKVGGNIRTIRNSTSNPNGTNENIDDWSINIDDIIVDLETIGTGNEGCVYRCKLRGQNFACKRVKSEEHTRIKHLKKLNHTNVMKFRGRIKY